MTKPPAKKSHSAIVHVLHGTPTGPVRMALIEQLFQMRGPTAVARFIAKHLRDPSPPRWALDVVARWLDGDDCFKLVVVRQRDKESWTKRVNDTAIIKLAQKYRQERIEAGRKHDSKAYAARKVAEDLGISLSKVWKVMQARAKPTLE
jgi:hypothetical protein